MSYRERESYRKFMAEEREATEKPIREAEALLKRTHAKLLKVQQDTLTNPEVQDQDVWVDAAVAGVSMPESQAIPFNTEHLREFCNAHPEFAVTDRNLDVLGGYFERHGIGLVTCEMLRKLYHRMRDAGVEFDRPAPRPEPTRLATAPAAPPKPKSAEPETQTGRDYATGQPREFTRREIARMSSAEYRRAFAVLPDVGSLFSALADQREKA